MKTILAVRASLHFHNYKIKIKLLITVFNIIFPVSGVFSWRNNFAFASVINKRTYSSKEEYWPYCSWKCSSEGKRECTRMSLNICTVTAYLFWNKLWGEWIETEVSTLLSEFVHVEMHLVHLMVRWQRYSLGREIPLLSVKIYLFGKNRTVQLYLFTHFGTKLQLCNYL